MKDFVHVTVPNGESYIDLKKRVSKFYTEVLKNESEQIVIVTHAGVIRSLLAQLTNTPLEKSFDIKVIYGQISKITIGFTTKVIPSI
jgi:alpha-ribazole phosphatase